MHDLRELKKKRATLQGILLSIPANIKDLQRRLARLEKAQEDIPKELAQLEDRLHLRERDNNKEELEAKVKQAVAKAAALRYRLSNLEARG